MHYLVDGDDASRMAREGRSRKRDVYVLPEIKMGAIWCFRPVLGVDVLNAVPVGKVV